MNPLNININLVFSSDSNLIQSQPNLTQNSPIESTSEDRSPSPATDGSGTSKKPRARIRPKKTNEEWAGLARHCSKSNLKKLLLDMIDFYTVNPGKKDHLKHHAITIFDSLESPPEINNFLNVYNTLKTVNKIFFLKNIVPYLPFHLKNQPEFVEAEKEFNEKESNKKEMSNLKRKRSGSTPEPISPSVEKRQKLELEEDSSEGETKHIESMTNTLSFPQRIITSSPLALQTSKSPSENSPHVQSTHQTHSSSIPNLPNTSSFISSPTTQSVLSNSLTPPPHLTNSIPTPYLPTSVLLSPSIPSPLAMYKNLSHEEQHKILQVSAFFIGHIGVAFFPNSIEKPYFDFLLEKGKGLPIFNLANFSATGSMNTNAIKVILTPFYKFLLKIDAEKTERTEEIFKVLWINAFYTAGIIYTKSQPIPFEPLFPGVCKDGTAIAVHFEQAIAKSTQWHKKNLSISNNKQSKLDFSKIHPMAKPNVYLNFFSSIMIKVFAQYSHIELLLKPYNYENKNIIDLTDKELMPPPPPKHSSHKGTYEGEEGQSRLAQIGSMDTYLTLNRLPETINRISSIPQFQSSNSQYPLTAHGQQMSASSPSTSPASASSYPLNQSLPNSPSFPHNYSSYAPYYYAPGPYYYGSTNYPILTNYGPAANAISYPTYNQSYSNYSSQYPYSAPLHNHIYGVAPNYLHPQVQNNGPPTNPSNSASQVNSNLNLGQGEGRS